MGGYPPRESKRQRSGFNPIETHMHNICILNACNMYINLYTERSSVAIKPLTIWRKPSHETTRYNKKPTR